ncbi:MAG: phosphoribosylformylglycinamidine synthase subunit PurL [Acidimicrobiia bacterium]
MLDTRHHELGLTNDEYLLITRTLKRPPEDAELALFSVMWSEHCSYKSSRVLLDRLPDEAPWVVVGPGQNAGVVDIGDGWLAALRIESHNHPSFVEPYEGAATGIGGILRDVFTMGARPIALWDQIRFGPLEDATSRYLFEGVVAGIAGYGNAVGVPTVGGEVDFDDCYRQNPLVNVMALGLLRRDDLVLAEAGPEGTVAVLLGSATGRDGIGGASVLASAGFDSAAASKRPSVQVGDPFAEKKLIEACLTLYERGLVVGIQDLGAGGLGCASSEPVARSGVGLDLDLDSVHTRESGMTAAELLISESQERMLAFVRPEHLTAVQEVAARWEIRASVVGVVKEDETLRARLAGDVVVDLPPSTLTAGAPTYRRPAERPAWLRDLWDDEPSPEAPDLADTLFTLLDEPGLADRSWVYEQYDHQLFLNTLLGPGHDGSLLRVKGTAKGLAVSTDGNGRACQLDPRNGASRLVFEAALNVAVLGAQPWAVVDNLNFGSPEDPTVMWQFAETVEGIATACEALGVPVVGGNVSFYNETAGTAIFPTPVIGMLGLSDPAPERVPRLDRAKEGAEVWLLGPRSVDLAGTAFDHLARGHLGGRPEPPSSAAGRATVRAAKDLATGGLCPVLHDLSAGGLLIALAEICIRSGVGAVLAYEDWRELFSEGPHRLLAAIEPEAAPEVTAIARSHDLPARCIGRFGGDHIAIVGGDAGKASIQLRRAATVWRDAIPRRLRRNS